MKGVPAGPRRVNLTEVRQLGRVGREQNFETVEAIPGRSALQRGDWGSAAAWAAVILGRLAGQFELEAVKEQRQLGLGLGVASQLQFAAVGGGDVNVDHLNGGEFLEHAARGQARRERFQAAPRVTCRQ